MIRRIQALSPERRRALFAVLEREGERYDVHPLTRAQARMWLLSQLRPDSPVYNVAYTFRITGDLDAQALERALGTVVARHEALRSVFVSIDGEPRQMVLPPDPGVRWLDVVDLTDEVPMGSVRDRLGELAAEEARRPFDLASGPLIRAMLARTGSADWVVLLTLHHIVCDGWSMRILYDDLAEAYTAHRDGREPALPELPRYVDVARRQEESLDPETRERLLVHWTRALSGAPRTLDVRTDRPRPPALSDDGDQVAFALPAELATLVESSAQRLGTTPFVVLLAACHALLYRYSHQSDILIGAPAAGRAALDTEGVVGLFVNTLVLRARMSVEMSFSQLLDQVRGTALAAITHQEMPFEHLVERLGADREPSSQPLFQVMLAVEDGEAERLELPGLTVRCEENHTGTAKFDLTFVLLPGPELIEGRVEYRTELFDRATIVRLIEHFRTMLEAALDDPARLLGDLPLLSAGEQQRLAGWSSTRPPSPDTRPVHALIEDVTDGTPDAPAIVCSDQTLTYRQLDDRANRLAGLLRAHGVGRERPVAVCLPSSPDLVAGLLGTLKAGGVYVPLDARLPVERLRALIDDAGVAVVLAHSETRSRLPAAGVTVVELDREDPASAFAATRPQVTVMPEGAAYLIYTSGSTGRPKGVVGTHRGLRNLAQAQRDLIGVHPADRLLQFHSCGFDVSISEILTALTAGAQLHLVSPEERQPGPELARTIREHGITVADLPPVTLGAMESADLPGLRSLTVGGEPCPLDVAAQWAQGRDFFNAYGPTETTVTATAARYATGGVTLPIGLPVTGASAYVLDARLEPVPVGVAGELYIGGACVARGYRGDAGLTAQRFPPDPFAGGGQRMYRTGDIVRRLPDGSLDFLGRADSQVKVRGHRIELGEVEARLRACAGVRRSAVVVRQHQPAEDRLVGYVIGEGLTVDALRAELQRHLPGYMLPAAFVFVDDLPMTPNGKLDRRALPAPSAERPSLTAAYTAPSQGLEESVVAVWQDVLGLARVGIHDNFFDLGGNSLLLAKARARLVELVGREVPAVELFRHPTVALLARFLADTPEPDAPPQGRHQHVQQRRRALNARADRLRERQPPMGSA